MSGIGDGIITCSDPRHTALESQLQRETERRAEVEEKLRDMTARAMGHAYATSMAESGEELQAQELAHERQQHKETLAELRATEQMVFDLRAKLAAAELRVRDLEENSKYAADAAEVARLIHERDMQATLAMRIAHEKHGLEAAARALSSRMHICAMRINDDDLCGGLATCEYRGLTGVHLYFCDKHRARSTDDLPWAEEMRTIVSLLAASAATPESTKETT